MTLTELQALSGACPSDTEFLERPEVKLAYWKAMGQEGSWRHNPSADRDRRGACLAGCGGVWNPLTQRWETRRRKDGVWIVMGPECPSADPIPGSLADAVERLREKICSTRRTHEVEDRLIVAVETCSIGPRWWDKLVQDTARHRFMFFVATLGGVEIE